VRLLLLNIKLYIGITEAITKLAAATAPVQHIAEILVRQGVTLPSPWRLLGGGGMEPFVDVVARRRGIAQRQAFGGAATATSRRRR
jgi:hypothetical protein